ncbi:autoinducer binding domain-containing protein [Agrobacterium sp. ES01]|uniref:helix-turn-helix transcriptional regulator n=1 Tax=Agrobacterium sp. ES01 TaxID=3420714 RepID=UPI003D0FAD97
MTGDDSSGRNEIVAGVQAAETLKDIGELIVTIRDRFGFSYYKVYCSYPVEHMPLREQLLIYSFPESFMDHFEAIGRRICLPSAAFDLSKSLSYQWGVAEFAEGLDPSQHAIMSDLLVRFKINRGAYLAMNGLKGTERIIGFYGDRERLSEEEMEELSFLSIQVIHRLREFDKRAGLAGSGLSDLEIRCLELASAGGDSELLARELSLSIRTIRYLVSGLCGKLGVERLEQAVAEALRRGYIS